MVYQVPVAVCDFATPHMHFSWLPMWHPKTIPGVQGNRWSGTDKIVQRKMRWLHNTYPEAQAGRKKGRKERNACNNLTGLSKR